MARKRHPSKEIETALRYAETHGWLAGRDGRSSRLGQNVLPEKSVDVPMWGVLSDLHLEHTEKCTSACPGAAARGR